MYSYEQRIKAVELLIQYDMSYAAVDQSLLREICKDRE